MADEPQNLVLEHLRRIDRKVDGLLEEFRHFNLRVGSIENHTVSLHLSDVQQNGEIDRIKNRLDRIERRLELVDD
jgi:tetrahydromethanopterin S-methyltransferase subunit G